MKKVLFILPFLIISIILVVYFISPQSSSNKISKEQLNEYLTTVNQLIKSSEEVIDKANELGKELESKNTDYNKFLNKYFQQVLDKIDALEQQFMMIPVPQQLNQAHLYIILYIKWVNIGLYEIISRSNNNQTEFCILRADEYKKTFEENIKSLQVN